MKDLIEKGVESRAILDRGDLELLAVEFVGAKNRRSSRGGVSPSGSGSEKT